jgi:hypothetical protein
MILPTPLFQDKIHIKDIRWKVKGQKRRSREDMKLRCRGTDAAVDLVHWVE